MFLEDFGYNFMQEICQTYDFSDKFEEAHSMKGGSVNKKRNFIRPSPNEEAAIVQSEQERRKKIRLKQVREQEKAFAIKIRQNIKAKRENEFKVLSEQLKEQWTEKQQAELSNLEKKYQKNLEKLGDGHTAAMKDQDALKKDQRTLTKEERQRAIQRHNQAIYELSLERTRSQQAENDHAAARAKAAEAEKTRAAMIASLPPTRDMIQDFELREQKRQPKSVEDFKSTRYHLQQPVIQVERMSKENQIDARVAAAEEEDKIHGIREEIQRSEAEQAEKAHLRHKHALAQLKIEEDRKKLMDDLSELERLDRQRRQEAVARIPVRIFQPPHKRIEDAENRQRDLEQAFEDMYMIQTGYTGDLTIALEPSMDPTTISGEHQPQGLEDASEKSPTAMIPSISIPHDQESTEDSPRGLGEGSEETAERREDKTGQTAKEERESVPAKGEDAVKRLLLRIKRQREQGKIIKDQTTSDEQIPRQPPVSRTATRVPGSRVNILTPLPEEEEEQEPPREEDTSPTLPPESQTTITTQQDIPGVVPRDGSLEARTLLHPYEAAQQVRMVRPQRTEEGSSSSKSSGTVPESPVSQEPELLEQQRLQLQLQEQRKIQERLEEQLEHYHRQFQKISSEIPKGPYAPEEEPSAGGPRRMVAGGAEPTDEEADSFDQINIPVQRFRKEEEQRELPLVGGHVISSEQSEDGSTSSRRSGTVSLEEQTLEEESTSESSKSTSDYGISRPSGASPPRDSLEDSKKRSLEDPIPMIGDYPSDVSNSDDSHGVSSSDYSFQRGTRISHMRDQAAGFMPLEWQKDSRIGSWKPTPQEYPLKRRNHETTQDTVPAESSTDSGGHLESEEVTSTSDSTSDVPHSQLLELLERRHVQPFSQSDSGFVPTLSRSSLGAATDVLKSGTVPKKITGSVRSKNSGQVDEMFLPSSSYPGDSKGTAYSSSLRQRQDTISVSATPSSVIGQTTPSLSRLLDGSPNYLDEYRRKWEEEKKLIENQRQLIRQKQEHQLRRMRYYQDILERYENNSPSGLDVRAPVTSPETESVISSAVVTNIPSKTELASTALLISDSFKSRSDSSERKSASDISYQFQSTNRENESVHANAAPRVPPLVGLKGSSSSSDNSLFTRVSYPWSSSSSGRGSKRFLPTSKYSEAARETRKSTSTSDFSFPSSGTEYHSFPVSPEVSANLGPPNDSRSSIATLSELTDRMTKLTSSSDNESGSRGLVFEKVPDKGNWADYLSENRAPGYEPSIKYAHPWYQPPTSSSLFTGTEDQMAAGETITSRQWYMPAKPSTASIGSLGPVGEDDSARNVNDPDRAARIDEGIKPPPSSSIRPMGSVGPIFEDISPNTNNLEDQSPGTQQWYLPPKSSIQSMVSYGTSSDISNPNISNLQYPDGVSESRLQAQQWFVPPKSSLQSVGTPGVFSDGSSPNTSDVKNTDNLLKSVQRLGEQWYLPVLSRDSEKGESSPERSLYSQSVLRDIQRERTPTSSSARMPDFPTAVIGSSEVTKETLQPFMTADSVAVSESVRSEGTATRIEGVGDVFFSPSFKQKEYSDERAVLSPASLSSGSLTSDVSNKLSSQSATSTPEKIDKGNKSDQDHATESTDKEPGRPSKDGTGIEISSASTHTEATEEDDPSYSDIYLDYVGSSATALQDAFARRKQDFVKKSLARVERAKAKRFEVTPRVMLKKRVKPAKPVKPVVPKIIKKSEGVETKERSSMRKRKK